MINLNKLIRLLYYSIKYDISPIEFFNVSTKSKISSKVNLLGSYNITNSEINDYTYLAPNAKVSYTTIGKYCSIGPNFLCGWGIHPIDGISTSPMFYSIMKQNGYAICKKSKVDERKYVTIGNDVFIGANVTVLDGVTIGDGSVIGAGAVVSKNIPPYAVAVGCPIRIIKYRFKEDVIQQMLELEWWNKEDSIHSKIEKNFFDIEKFLCQLSNTTYANNTDEK